MVITDSMRHLLEAAIKDPDRKVGPRTRPEYAAVQNLQKAGLVDAYFRLTNTAVRLLGGEP